MILTSVWGSGRPSVSARSAAVSATLVIVMAQLDSVCAKAITNGTPKRRLDLPDQVGGETAPPLSAYRSAGQVALGRVGVAEQRGQHGRHAAQQVPR